MPINYNTVKVNLHTWATAVLPVGTPIIFWQQNSPRPSVPYVTLHLDNFMAINQDWKNHLTNNLGDVLMKGDRNFTLSINAYGGDPITLLENLRSSFQRNSSLALLRTYGIAFYQSETINDLSDLVDSKFEKRAQMDVRLGIGQNYDDNSGYFNIIQITETIFDQSNDIIYTQIINIP